MERVKRKYFVEWKTFATTEISQHAVLIEQFIKANMNKSNRFW
jgi:hypothetical protein